MAEFIIRHWLAVIFGGITTVLGVCYKKIANSIKRERLEQKLMKEALLAILHDRLYQLCNEHIHQGCITIDAMKNIEYIYNSYHALGGNSTGTELYNRVKSLPIKKEN